MKPEKVYLETTEGDFEQCLKIIKNFSISVFIKMT